MKKQTEFKVWKTIKIGTGLKDANAFRRTLESGEFVFVGHTYMLDDNSSFVVALKETEVDLVNVSVGELGFNAGAKYQKIRTKAQKLGLRLCPAEVGPQLRLQYKDQPKGEGLRVAMEAVTDSNGHRGIFAVCHFNDEFLLYGITGSPERFYDDFCRFVFVLPRK